MSPRTKSAVDDGSTLALTQAADWVRFADTKATVLTAAFGVVVTMLMSNSPAILQAGRAGATQQLWVGIPSGIAVAAFLFTLVALLTAIAPRRRHASSINRFSWPSMSAVATKDLECHLATVSARQDAWQQAMVLSKVADEKFAACRRAVWGFAVLVLSAVAAIIIARTMNG